MTETYPLQDVSDPNLVEDIFPYTLPPLIKFDGRWTEDVEGRQVTFDPAARAKADIHITDTTFRDGQQARPPYTVEQQVKLYEMISKLGGPNGVVRPAIKPRRFSVSRIRLSFSPFQTKDPSARTALSKSGSESFICMPEISTVSPPRASRRFDRRLKRRHPMRPRRLGRAACRY